MKISRIQSITCTYSAVALILLVSTCSSSPLGSSSDITKRQTTPCVEQPITRCAHTKGRSEFYHHCIEAMFPCGSEGFVMSYALPRFNKVNKELSHISQGLTDYLHTAEVCFQTKLEQLALRVSRNRLPNAESCLYFEKEAIELMNECFKEEKQALCSLLSNSDQAHQTTLHDHLRSVVATLRIGGDYFNNTVVDLGIPEAVRDCGSSELANSLVSDKLRVKVTWCAALIDYIPSLPPVTEAQQIEKLAQHLNRPTNQFVFSGPDELDLCNRVTELSYSLISWFAEPQDSLLSANPIQAYANRVTESNNKQYYVQYHELSSAEREPSQCGDGIRQAGEMCDFANNMDGCDHSCNVNYGYKCSTERLNASVCVYEEVQRFERPVLCEATSRRGQSISSDSHSRIQPLFSNTLVSDQDTAGTSSALSVRTLNLPMLVLIAVVCCLLVPRL